MKNCELCETIDWTLQTNKDIDKGNKPGSDLKRYYKCAFVEEIFVKGDFRGRSTHYSNLELRYCPACGKMIEK